MRRTIASVATVVCVCALASSAGAASSRERKRAKRVKISPADRESLTHGPDIWAQVEERLDRGGDGAIIYRENVPVDPDAPRPWVSGVRGAAAAQTFSAPNWGLTGPEGAICPIVIEDVVDGFIDRFREALTLMDVVEQESRREKEGEGDEQTEADEKTDVTAEALEAMKDISRDFLIRSRELVRYYAALAREQRVEGEGRLKIDPELHRGKVEESILAATEEWLEVVERLETSAMRLRRGALMRSPERLRKAWKALLAAGLEIPQLRSSMQAILVKRERRKPRK